MLTLDLYELYFIYRFYIYIQKHKIKLFILLFHSVHITTVLDID